MKSSGALLYKAAGKLGLTAVPGPLAIITKPYMGRAACVNCGICSGYGCQVKARSSSAVTMLPLAEKTGRCEIRVKSYVREITLGQSCFSPVFVQLGLLWLRVDGGKPGFPR